MSPAQRMAHYFATTNPQELSRREIRLSLHKARRLGCWAQVPEDWKAALAKKQPDHIPPERTAFSTCLEVKSTVTKIPDVVFMEIARRASIVYRHMVESEGPQPVTAQQHAQARINSFIRLTQCDPGARTDDADLLRLVHDCED